MVVLAVALFAMDTPANPQFGPCHPEAPICSLLPGCHIETSLPPCDPYTFIDPGYGGWECAGKCGWKFCWNGFVCPCGEPLAYAVCD